MIVFRVFNTIVAVGVLGAAAYFAFKSKFTVNLVCIVNILCEAVEMERDLCVVKTKLICSCLP